MIKQNVAKILETEVERKDFLKLVGLGAVAAVGVTSILRAVTPSQNNRPKTAAVDNSYGGMSYGGVKTIR
jgi:hypothetical protein